MFRVFLRKFLCSNFSPVLLKSFKREGFNNLCSFLKVSEVVVDPFDFEGVYDLGVVMVSVHFLNV